MKYFFVVALALGMCCSFELGSSLTSGRGCRRAVDLSMSSKIPSQICVIAPLNRDSKGFTRKPFGDAVTWGTIFEQVQTKLLWEGPNGRYDESQGEISISLLDADTLKDMPWTTQIDADMDSAAKSDIVVMVGLDESHEETVRKLIEDRVEEVSAICSFDCSAGYDTMRKYGAYTPRNDSNLLLTIRDYVGKITKSKRHQGKEASEILSELWTRKSSDDMVFLMLLLIHSFTKYNVKSVVAATSSDSTGFKELTCMCSKCSKEMINCLSNPECKKALDCLDNCKANDQVCSYKCITSYETKEFEAFAQCILQKNNCMGNSAEIPMTPNPLPMTYFRSTEFTHEQAEGIFIGHLQPREGEANELLPLSAASDLSESAVDGLRPWSWKVVAGFNPAYDIFSDQHQIFYREKKRPKIMWYDPVFKVITLDGKEVWRRRHYRVRRGELPGQFRFTVLDNGVLSDEFWRILDCADDLSWGVFYYSGAAAKAGTSYTGALVVTRDGYWPDKSDRKAYERIEAALGTAGMALWESFEVKQSEVNLSEPPLELS